jgi:hypothetical protein
MNWTTEQIKQLVEKYPYLAPHSSWTGKLVEDYDYSYTELQCLPEGWHRLFLLLCKELRTHIEKAGLLSTWYFTQVKEKYGMMRVYTCCMPKSIDHIIDLYECYSKYVCCICGEDASWETTGWINYLCNNCAKKDTQSTMYPVKYKKTTTIECYNNNTHEKLQYSFRLIRTKYNQVSKMTDNEFLEYLLT